MGWSWVLLGLPCRNSVCMCLSICLSVRLWVWVGCTCMYVHSTLPLLCHFFVLHPPAAGSFFQLREQINEVNLSEDELHSLIEILLAKRQENEAWQEVGGCVCASYDTYTCTSCWLLMYVCRQKTFLHVSFVLVCT